MVTQVNSQTTHENNQLTPLPVFKKYGRCPLGLYHLLFYHKQSLVDYGAFIRFGKRWLVDEQRFFNWLREHEEKGSHPIK